MSVTFAPEFKTTDVVGYVLSCCPECRSEQFATRADAEAARAALPGINDYTAALPGCPNVEWTGGGPVRIEAVLAEEGPTLNMSNVNARFVLDRLGLVDETGDLCGSASPGDLRGRILLAEALAGGDEGVPAVTTSSGGATFIDCGRAPGYLDERLVTLTELADWCEQRGRRIDWA